MKLYYVYIVRCADGSLYTGVTNDVERRVAEHNLGLDPDCYTCSRRPVALAYAGDFAWVDQAIAFEKRVKGWTRRKKEALIAGAWDDIKKYARGKNRH